MGAALCKEDCRCPPERECTGEVDSFQARREAPPGFVSAFSALPETDFGPASQQCFPGTPETHFGPRVQQLLKYAEDSSPRSQFSRETTLGVKCKPSLSAEDTGLSSSQSLSHLQDTGFSSAASTFRSPSPMRPDRSADFASAAVAHSVSRSSASSAMELSGTNELTWLRHEVQRLQLTTKRMRIKSEQDDSTASKELISLRRALREKEAALSRAGVASIERERRASMRLEEARAEQARMLTAECMAGRELTSRAEAAAEHEFSQLRSALALKEASLLEARASLYELQKTTKQLREECAAADTSLQPNDEEEEEARRGTAADEQIRDAAGQHDPAEDIQMVPSERVHQLRSRADASTGSPRLPDVNASDLCCTVKEKEAAFVEHVREEIATAEGAAGAEGAKAGQQNEKAYSSSTSPELQ